MPVDPAAGFALDPDGRTAERLADLERRLGALERGAPTIQVVEATPTSTPRDGTPAVELGTPPHRFWVRIAGSWRYVNLT